MSRGGFHIRPIIHKGRNGSCPYCQERAHEKLLESLKITLKEALDFNRNDALTASGNDYQEEQIAL